MLEEKVRHLEMVQKIISRLANNSFLIKGWCITTTLAGIGFFLSNYNPITPFLIFFSVTISWILDSYYLRQERLYRKLYEAVASIKSTGKTYTYNMRITDFEDEVDDIPLTMISFPNVLLYTALLIVIFFILANF